MASKWIYSQDNEILLNVNHIIAFERYAYDCAINPEDPQDITVGISAQCVKRSDRPSIFVAKDKAAVDQEMKKLTTWLGSDSDGIYRIDSQ